MSADVGFPDATGTASYDGVKLIPYSFKLIQKLHFYHVLFIKFFNEIRRPFFLNGRKTSAHILGNRNILNWRAACDQMDGPQSRKNEL
jgi:hypothetical protein